MSNVTRLNKRELTYTGVSIVDPKLFSPPDPLVIDLLKTGARVRVKEITAPIDQYNQFTNTPVTTPTDSDFMPMQAQYVLPARYKALNIVKYCQTLLVDDIKHRSIDDQIKRVARFDDEMEWYVTHHKQNMLRTLVYIVDTLENNQVPWGVGRGSCVASYVLYLIGVHDIDPVKYNLDWREFLRDEE